MAEKSQRAQATRPSTACITGEASTKLPGNWSTRCVTVPSAPSVSSARVCAYSASAAASRSPACSSISSWRAGSPSPAAARCHSAAHSSGRSRCRRCCRASRNRSCSLSVGSVASSGVTNRPRRSISSSSSAARGLPDTAAARAAVSSGSTEVRNRKQRNSSLCWSMTSVARKSNIARSLLDGARPGPRDSARRRPAAQPWVRSSSASSASAPIGARPAALPSRSTSSRSNCRSSWRNSASSPCARSRASAIGGSRRVDSATVQRGPRRGSRRSSRSKKASSSTRCRSSKTSTPCGTSQASSASSSSATARARVAASPACAISASGAVRQGRS